MFKLWNRNNICLVDLIRDFGSLLYNLCMNLQKLLNNVVLIDFSLVLLVCTMLVLGGISLFPLYFFFLKNIIVMSFQESESWNHSSMKHQHLLYLHINPYVYWSVLCLVLSINSVEQSSSCYLRSDPFASSSRKCIVVSTQFQSHLLHKKPYQILSEIFVHLNFLMY